MSCAERRSSSCRVLVLLIGLAGLSLIIALAWQGQDRPAAKKGLQSPASERPALTDAEAAEVRARLGLDRPVPQNVDLTGPRVVPLGPLVAEQIDLDPSITQPVEVAASQPLIQHDLNLNRPQGPLELRPAATTIQPLAPDPVEPESPDSQSPGVQPLREPAEPPAVISAAEPATAFPATKAWPYPAGLVEQLNILAATTPPAVRWAERVKAEIEQLVLVDSLNDPAASVPLKNLSKLAEEGRAIAMAQDSESEARSQILRAGYAIVRRLAVWELVRAQAAREDIVQAPEVDRQAWLAAMAEVDSQLQATGAAAHWRNYLLIDRAGEEFDSSACSPADQRRLARDILHRMHSSQLSYAQQQFLKSPHFVALDEQLQARAAESPDLVALLSAIEHHEHDDTSAHARALAAQYAVLRWDPDPGIRELSESVNTYYRNANVRVALSADLVNRLLPQENTQVEPVQDTIVGAYVEGQSHTRTQLRLVLLPDRSRWQIGLEALGHVASDTASTKGPATFYQKGHAFFRARKRLTVDRRGIRLFNAEANADSNNNLNDFETDFDGIPLLSNLARSVARSQYDASQFEAKMEVEGKIVVRATSQLDRQVAARLTKAQQDVQGRLIDPLQRLNLEPTAVDLETTAERLIARYRLAAGNQISAHTPRPQAPGDSLLSVQVHETAMNNILEKINLNSRRIELRELFKEITGRFNREPVPVPEDLPEDVYVTFADEDPVRLDCQDGRVRLTIRLKELDSGGRNKWHNFTVRGYYVPHPDQLDANLVREGIIELIGDREIIRIGDQIALRGIFSRVLSRNRKLNLVNKEIARAPELQDQQVTQFVIHDGWIGIALGPKMPGRRVAMHPRPHSDDGTEMD